ncbi:MAG TPA: hypothetical protein V6D19_17570 [Stenomitos sp.]
MESVLASGLSLSQITCAPRLESNTWVTLLEKPSDYSFDEALLLCQVSFSEWLAWVPDYGEVCLNTSQFYVSN